MPKMVKGNYKMTDFSHQKALIKSILENHRGKANPMVRIELVKRIGLDDRMVRELIRELRHAGLPIVNMGAGYFVAINVLELQAAKNRALSYLRSFGEDIEDYDEAEAKLFGDQGGLWAVGKRNLDNMRGVKT